MIRFERGGIDLQEDRRRCAVRIPDQKDRRTHGCRRDKPIAVAGPIRAGTESLVQVPGGLCGGHDEAEGDGGESMIYADGLRFSRDDHRSVGRVYCRGKHRQGRARDEAGQMNRRDKERLRSSIATTVQHGLLGCGSGRIVRTERKFRHSVSRCSSRMMLRGAGARFTCHAW